MNGPPSPWPLAAWAMSSFTLLALGTAIFGRVLSAALVLDLVALWPLLIPLVPALVALILRPRSRLAGAAPLVILTWLLVGLALHLSAWDALPSSAGDVRSGLVSSAQEATITVRSSEGRVLVTGGDELVVAMERIGGRTGAPSVEVVGSEPVGVSVVAGEAEGWFRFGGIEVAIPTGPIWGLDIGASTIDADLTGLRVRSATIVGDAGTVRLGSVTETVVVTVGGPLRIIVPDDVPVAVDGPARVPDGWSAAGDLRQAPVDGDGWEIIVDAAAGTVSIEYP